MACSITESTCAVLSTELLDDLERKSEINGICFYRNFWRDFCLFTWCYFALDLPKSFERKCISMHAYVSVYIHDQEKRNRKMAVPHWATKVHALQKKNYFRNFRKKYSNAIILWIEAENYIVLYNILRPLHYICT